MFEALAGPEVRAPEGGPAPAPRASVAPAAREGKHAGRTGRWMLRARGLGRNGHRRRAAVDRNLGDGRSLAG